MSSIEKNISKINCSMGMTINLGNFESIRFDSSIELVKTDDISSEDLYEHAWNRVRDEVLKKSSEAQCLKNK
jgi:hypothetical protein